MSHSFNYLHPPKTLPLEKSLIYGFEGAISPSLQMIQKMMLLQNVAEISTGYKKIMPIVFCNEYVTKKSSNERPKYLLKVNTTR